MTKKGIKRERLTDQMRAFLAAYEGCLVVSDACVIAGVDRRRVYEWRDKSQKFREAYEESHEAGVGRIEREAYRRAVEGVARKKFDSKGEVIYDPETGKPYVEHLYSDKILMMLLKRYKPEEYAETSLVGVFPGNPGAAGSRSPLQAGPTTSELLAELHKDPALVDALRIAHSEATPMPEVVG